MGGAAFAAKKQKVKTVYVGVGYESDFSYLNEQGEPDLPAIRAAAADPKVSGVMNSCACSVRIVSTLYPFLTSPLATEAALKAAMPPVTPRRTVF